jgi:DNA/RNA non-specific endonuclease
MSPIKLTALILALTPIAFAQPGRFGFPACAGPTLELADHGFFLLCHDSSRKVPLWVAYELTPEHLIRVASYRGRFSRDLQLSGPTAADSDYSHSGWSEVAIRSTFVLSNAVPLLQSVNAGPLARIEAAVRRPRQHRGTAARIRSSCLSPVTRDPNLSALPFQSLPQKLASADSPPAISFDWEPPRWLRRASHQQLFDKLTL